jgi:uncharacterized protein YndB with AHSA1/START domain
MSDMSDEPNAPNAEEAVHLERLLPGPIERVWEQLTSPEHLAEWLEADGGVITHSEPPQRISYTRQADDSEVTFELEPQGEDVLLKIIHRRAVTARSSALQRVLVRAPALAA